MSIASAYILHCVLANRALWCDKFNLRLLFSPNRLNFSYPMSNACYCSIKWKHTYLSNGIKRDVNYATRYFLHMNKLTGIIYFTSEQERSLYSASFATRCHESVFKLPIFLFPKWCIELTNLIEATKLTGMTVPSAQGEMPVFTQTTASAAINQKLCAYRSSVLLVNVKEMAQLSVELTCT